MLIYHAISLAIRPDSLLILVHSQSFAAYDPDAPMSKVINGDIEIAYLDVGEKSADPILIIMGLAASHRIWNPAIIDGLLQGGYQWCC